MGLVRLLRFGGRGGGVVQNRESPDFRSLEVGISVRSYLQKHKQKNSKTDPFGIKKAEKHVEKNNGKVYLPYILFSLQNKLTLGARVFSSAVSGLASAFGQHRKFPPRARETSAVPRVKQTFLP